MTYDPLNQFLVNLGSLKHVFRRLCVMILRGNTKMFFNLVFVKLKVTHVSCLEIADTECLNFVRSSSACGLFYKCCLSHFPTDSGHTASDLVKGQVIKYV